jgi:hypothetical protein
MKFTICPSLGVQYTDYLIWCQALKINIKPWGLVLYFLPVLGINCGSHDIVPLMMGILMPETCWAKEHRIRFIRVESSWFFILPNFTMHYHMSIKNVQQFLYMSEQAMKVPGCWDSHISWHLANKGDKVVSLTRQSPLPLRKYSCYFFLLEAESIPGP